MPKLQSQPRSSHSVLVHNMRIDVGQIDAEPYTGPSKVYVATVSGEIDRLSAPELRGFISNVTASSHRLVLDLTKVDFLGAAGLEILASHASPIPQQRSHWVVVANNRAVLRPLEASTLIDRVPLYSTVEAAVDVVT